MTETLRPERKPPESDLWQQVLQYFCLPGVYTTSGEHQLARPTKDEYGVDFDLLVSDPIRCRKIVDLFTQKIKEVQKIDLIHLLLFLKKDGKITSGASQLSLMLSYATLLPHRIIDPEFSFPPTGFPGQNVAIVSDHESTGEGLKKAVEIVSLSDKRVTRIFMFSVRPEMFPWEYFGEKMIAVHWLYKIPWDLLDHDIEPQVRY